MKKLLGKTTSYAAFRRALREYRNCPRYDGLSPAQMYYGWRQRTDAVVLPVAYECIPDATIAEHEAQREEKIVKQQSCADRSSRQRALMEPGQVVIAQHMLTKRWDQRGTIIERQSNGRSYMVSINERRYLRNRRYLRPSPIQADPTGSADTIKTPYEAAATPEPIMATSRYPKRDQQQRKPFEADKPRKRRRF